MSSPLDEFPFIFFPFKTTHAAPVAASSLSHLHVCEHTHTHTSVCCTAFLPPTSSPIQNNSGVQMTCTSKKKEGRKESKRPINFTQCVRWDAEAAAQVAPREKEREHKAAELNWREKVPLMMLACGGCPGSRRRRVSAPNWVSLSEPARQRANSGAHVGVLAYRADQVHAGPLLCFRVTLFACQRRQNLSFA